VQLANQLGQRPLTPGKHLIIPTHPIAMAHVHPLVAKIKKILPGDTLYMVRRGDTIEKIAHKFHTSASSIRLANLIDNSSLAEGEKLIISTHIQS
jgi:LysM repeat protein